MYWWKLYCMPYKFVIISLLFKWVANTYSKWSSPHFAAIPQKINLNNNHEVYIFLFHENSLKYLSKL